MVLSFIVKWVQTFIINYQFVYLIRVTPHRSSTNRFRETVCVSSSIKLYLVCNAMFTMAYHRRRSHGCKPLAFLK